MSNFSSGVYIDQGHGKHTPGKRTRTVVNESIGHTMLFNREHGTYGNTTKPVMSDGQTTFVLNHSISEINRSTISVYKNGICLIEGQEYYLNGVPTAIVLNRPIAPKDDDIEIRYKYFQGYIQNDVLLLPKGDFSMEELENVSPDLGDVFDVNRLIKTNPELSRYRSHKGTVIAFRLTEDGIFGDLQMNPAPSDDEHRLDALTISNTLKP